MNYGSGQCPWPPPIRRSITLPRGSSAHGAAGFRGRRCEASSTRRPSPRATWCTTPRPALPRSSTRCSTTTRPPVAPAMARRTRSSPSSRRGPHRRVAARDARPRRPPVRGALPAGAARRQARIGREIIRVQEVFGKLFNAGTEFERDGSQFDRLFEDGDRFELGVDRGGGAARPGPYAGRPRLRHRRRGVRRRHALHARLRHRARRLSRRRCAATLPVDPPAAGAARRDAAVPLPRLQGAGARGLRLGDDDRRGARAQHPRARGGRARTTSSPCAPRATARWRCRD